MSENTCHLLAYNFARDRRIVKINVSFQLSDPGFSLVCKFLRILFILCSIFEQIKLLNLVSFIGPRRSNDRFVWMKTTLFIFFPSKRDCSKLKGACQPRADTGQPSKGLRFVYWRCPVVGKALSTRNNPVLMDENRNNAAAFWSIYVEPII